ncbi:H(+)/Cl(-) exchange transporter 7-like [Lytechinus pictus]|uniref:H(+)/Cl(-) exchange transporter 7-like n=1 Tax=Lytechinus pictus TaxID=7653 RepID=UPI0030B9C8D7
MERQPLISGQSHPRSYSDIDVGHSLQNDVDQSEDDRQFSTLSTSVRRRLPWKQKASGKESDEIDRMNVLSAKYESLDYDEIENFLYLKEEKKFSSKSVHVLRKELSRWFVMLLTGIITGLIAVIIDVTIRRLSQLKYHTVRTLFIKDNYSTDIIKPFGVWLAMCIALVFVAVMLVAYVEPIAMGSGIPQIKCYLNGVKIPHVVRFKTLVCKVTGVIFAVAGGLTVGKEGPMIHAGAVVAAGVSQGRSTTFKKDFKLFQYFRSDHEKRDFVSGGAAAGVAAAFGAPVGGVLFSLEEGASFWNQSLTWRIFFCSMMSTFSLNVIMSAVNGDALSLSSPGLINFGEFTVPHDKVAYQAWEIPIFMVMGLVGGLLGALFNAINFRLTIFRMKYLYYPWSQVLEAMLVAAVTVTVSFLVIYISSGSDCRPLDDTIQFPLQLFCGDGEYSASSTLFFNTPEESVKLLFHKEPGSYDLPILSVFILTYFILACWTYGLSVPSGLFIPSLLVGAAWGRMCGILINMIPGATKYVSAPGIYALIGAAAQLGGVVRMTISLTVILMEATGNISYALPIMVVLMIAKWIGDIFNHGLYDIHIQVQSIPLLPWEPPPLGSTIRATEVMSDHVITFNTVERVSHIFEVLKDSSHNHNGFPVVDPDGETHRTFRGLILRSQLIVLLKEKAFSSWPSCQDPRVLLQIEDFRDAYPRFPDIRDINISELEGDCTVDLRPFMNPSPYTVRKDTSLPRIFRLFRALGLRHVVVTDDSNRVVGMVTRKDLAKYRYWSHKGTCGIEELHIAR